MTRDHSFVWKHEKIPVPNCRVASSALETAASRLDCIGTEATASNVLSALTCTVSDLEIENIFLLYLEHCPIGEPCGMSY